MTLILLVVGWRQAGWMGSLTSVISANLSLSVLLCALGAHDMALPLTSGIGRLQRISCLPLLGLSIGGAVFGGWKWGWLWSLVFYLAGALVFLGIESFVMRRQKRKKISLPSGGDEIPKPQSSSASLSEVAGVSEKRIEILLDNCESDELLLSTIARHGASREELIDLYNDLLAAAERAEFKGRNIAEYALTNERCLHFLLSSRNSSIDYLAKTIMDGLTSGHFGYVVMVGETTESNDDRISNDHLDEEKSGTALAPTKLPILYRIVVYIRYIYHSMRAERLLEVARYSEAAEHAELAVRTIFDYCHEDDPEMLNCLARANLGRAEYSKARQALERARKVVSNEMERFLSDDQKLKIRGDLLFTSAESHCLLAEVLLAINDLDGAIDSARRAVDHLVGALRRSELINKTLKDIYRCYSASLDLLGDIHLARHEPEKAQPLYRGALNFRTMYLGLTSVEVAVSQCKLAEFYRQVGRPDLAEPWLESAIRILEWNPLERDLRLSNAVLKHAVLAQEQGRFDEAEEGLRRCLALLEELKIDAPAPVIEPAIRLAVITAQAGRLKESRAFLEKITTAIEELATDVFSISSERQALSRY
jgi:tetratricopeptide (TPR) repeat protein